MVRLLCTTVLMAWSLLSFALSSEAQTQREGTPNDVVARVGDEVISFAMLNTLLNSAPVVGLSLPALGTPERNKTIAVLLDKAISANLLYLDAKAKGVDQDPDYRREVAAFEEGVLAGLYRADHAVGEVPVTDEEVQALYKQSADAATELDEGLRKALEASIRKSKFKARVATLRDRIRKGVQISVDETALDPLGDHKRDDGDVVARVDGASITWSEVKGGMGRVTARGKIAPMQVDEGAERQEALDSIIDTRIMAVRAREVGLDRDPRFTRRAQEFRKTRLINLHRTRLVREMMPTEEEVRAYYETNRHEIGVAETRKVQMVVLETREEAETVKARIESGEMTVYEAARDHSIDPRAKQTLGEIGWVKKGTGFPELDALTFSLPPEKLGGPVKSPAGWHLVTVLDFRDGAYQDVDDPATQREVRRRLIHARLGEYAANLRKTEFQVVVYEDVLRDLFRKEAEWIAAKTKEAEKDPQRAQRVMEEIRKLGGH